MSGERMFRPRTEQLENRETPSAVGIYALGGGPGSAPRVQVFDTLTGTLLGDFLAYEPTFKGGVNAAFGDVNNDGFPDLIVGAGDGGGPRIRVFDGRGFRPGLGAGFLAPLNGKDFFPENGILADFFAFEDTQRGGTFVASGNFAGASHAEIVVGAGVGGGPRVRILDGEQIASQGRLIYTSNAPQDTIANFFAFEPSFRNGVAVAASPPIFGGSFSDLVVTPGAGGGPRVRLLDGLAINSQRLQFNTFGPNDTIADFFAADPNTRSGLYVTSADFNSDGIADVAVGSGAGLSGGVIIYNGASMRNRRPFFDGKQPNDILDAFQVNPPTNVTGGPATYSNGVTIGATLVPGAINQGALIVGWGGQGRVARAEVYQFTVGPGFLTKTIIAEHVFDPNFVGGVFVSQ